jgi:hypothetical protein
MRWRAVGRAALAVWCAAAFAATAFAQTPVADEISWTLI